MSATLNDRLPSVHVRLSKNDKKDLEIICENLGLTVSAAIQMFAKAVIRNRGISFLPLQDEYESYKFDDLPKDTQEVVIRARERAEGKIPTGIQFNTAAEATAFLNKED